MALNFNASTAVVNHGAVLDNLNVGTVLVWLRPTALPGSVGRVYYKDAAKLVAVNQFSDNRMQFVYERGQNLRIVTAGSLTLNEWGFFAATWNTSGTNSDQRAYLGNLSTPATLDAATQVVGSGNHDDSGATVYVGQTGANTNNFIGDIGFLAVWNRQLTPAEIQNQQYRPYITSGCVLWVEYGLKNTSTQIDRSNTKANGTPTAVTQSTTHPQYRTVPPASIVQFVESSSGGTLIGVTLEDSFSFDADSGLGADLELEFSITEDAGGAFDDSNLQGTVTLGGAQTNVNPQETFTFSDTLIARRNLSRTLVG